MNAPLPGLAAREGAAGPGPALSITVHGRPAPQGSKRHVGRGVMVEASKRVAPWREAVKQAALACQQHRGEIRRWVARAGPAVDEMPLETTPEDAGLLW